MTTTKKKGKVLVAVAVRLGTASAISTVPDKQVEIATAIRHMLDEIKHEDTYASNDGRLAADVDLVEDVIDLLGLAADGDDRQAALVRASDDHDGIEICHYGCDTSSRPYRSFAAAIRSLCDDRSCWDDADDADDE